MRAPQDRETPVQVGQTPAFAWRYAYARSADSRAARDPGQDYLTFRADESAFVFALCDGVSQSFFGDLASRFLGDALLAWLSYELPASFDAAAIGDRLGLYLQELAPEATELVESRPLPDSIPPLFRDVLEQKRGMGSESMFVCGGLELASTTQPGGRLVLAWLGDSRLRLWGPSGERTAELHNALETSERWSSRVGPVGATPHVFVSPLDPHGGLNLMAYSDGLAGLDACAEPPSPETLAELFARADASPTSDDCSFLEILLLPKGAPCSA